MKKAIFVSLVAFFCGSFIFAQVPEAVQVNEMKKKYNELFRNPLSLSTITAQEKTDYDGMVVEFSEMPFSQIRDLFGTFMLLAASYQDPAISGSSGVSQDELNEGLRILDMFFQAIFEALSKRY